MPVEGVTATEGRPKDIGAASCTAGDVGAVAADDSGCDSGVAAAMDSEVSEFELAVRRASGTCAEDVVSGDVGDVTSV